MHNIRYWVRFLATYISKFKTLLFLSAIGAGIVFAALTYLRPYLTFLDQGESIGIIGSIDELPNSLQREISIGLTTLDSKDNVLPGLAQSWEYQDEGRVWIFKLGDFKWQDGTIVRAQDINYQFTDVASEVLDEKTIKFVLRDPFAPFPSVVTKPVFKKGLLGAGKWKVTKINNTKNNRLAGFLKLSDSNNETKTYKFYHNEEDARTALKLGEVSKLEEIVELDDLKSWSVLEITQVPRQDWYVGIFINIQDPILSEKSVRQALAYAIDKDQLGRERAISPISPKSWAFNPQVKQYNYNQERAKELLKTLPKAQREKLSVRLVTTPSLLNVADIIEKNWEEIGVKTDIQVSNNPTEGFQTLLAIQPIPPDPDQYILWHSTQVATNFTNYQNSKESQRIDKLLEDGRRVQDQEGRRAIYLDFQRFLVEDSPVIFLYHPVTYAISRNHL